MTIKTKKNGREIFILCVRERERERVVRPRSIFLQPIQGCIFLRRTTGSIQLFPESDGVSSRFLLFHGEMGRKERGIFLFLHGSDTVKGGGRNRGIYRNSAHCRPSSGCGTLVYFEGRGYKGGGLLNGSRLGTIQRTISRMFFLLSIGSDLVLKRISDLCSIRRVHVFHDGMQHS